MPALEPGFAGLERSVLTRIQTARAVSLWLRGRLAIVANPAEAPRKVAPIVGELAGLADPRAQIAAKLLAAGIAPTNEAVAAKLRDAERFAGEHGMVLYAAAARRQLGVLLGGSEGGELVADAETVMRAEEVASPERFGHWLAPGAVAR
jgi:hypothetical protein